MTQRMTESENGAYGDLGVIIFESGAARKVIRGVIVYFYRRRERASSATRRSASTSYCAKKHD
jgi:hypothetical protein